MTTVAGEKAEALLSRDLCDHCLGRQFAKLGHGLENYERGAIIREKGGELEESDFDPDRVPESASFGGSCTVCGEVFQEMDRYVDMVISSFDRYELSTFLVGIRPPEEVLASEESLWEDFGVEFTEPIKTELSRLIGKRIEERLDIEVDFDRPDIMAVVDMREGKERVELQVNSLLIYGQYNKYSREIPQTEWHCRNCRGDGCDDCDWTGKQYQESVQEIVQEPFMEATRSIEAKFHGGGREDVNARCLGKREFVLELVEPINRDLDLESLREKVNESEKVEVFNLRFAEKEEIEEIKQKHADKRYRAVVELEDDVTEKDLRDLQQLVGDVEQFTPSRVQHRRAETTREREVYEVEAEKLGERKIELEVEAEAGTYIKEMISGDGGNTEPSVAGVLGTGAECLELDVLWVEK
ncbi:MAG: tRNA pseudouridine(54/55) synthase Pus10 [Candidatus Nanohaloarchaea archaeon]